MTILQSDHELPMEQIRALRAEGRSVKRIARTLGVRPADVAEAVRSLTADIEAIDAGPPLVGCWVSPGWRQGLTVTGRHPDWPDVPDARTGTAGLVTVVVVRRDQRAQRVIACTYLVDVYCLGVKDCFGPRTLSRDRLPELFDKVFAGYPSHDPLQVPLDLVRHLVWGAVDYARGLGFEPHTDFAATSDHLGAPWQQASAIGFGQHGVPFYVDGPNDDPWSVIHTLEESVGRSNYDLLCAGLLDNAPAATT